MPLLIPVMLFAGVGGLYFVSDIVSEFKWLLLLSVVLLVLYIGLKLGGLL